MKFVAGAAALAAALAFPHAQAALLMGGTAGGGGGGTPIAFVQSGMNFSCVATTCAVTLTGTTAGNFFAVGAFTQDSIALHTIAGVATNNGRTCTLSPGSHAALSTANFSISDIYYCPNNPSGGSVTITVTFSTAPDIFGGAVVAEFSGVSTSSPDIGVGNQSTVTSASSATVTTNGNLTQANQLVFSTTAGSTIASAGGSQTVINGVASYQLTDSPLAPVTHTYNFTSSGQAWQSIAVFSHP